MSEQLTPREMELWRFAVRGFTAGYIARQLHLSVRTVETHLGSIYRKLGVQSRDELIERSTW